MLYMLQTLEDKNKILTADLAVERDQHASTRLEMSAECASVLFLTAQKAAFKFAVKVCFSTKLAALQELPNLQLCHTQCCYSLLIVLPMLQRLTQRNEKLDAELALERDEHMSTKAQLSAECGNVQSLAERCHHRDQLERYAVLKLSMQSCKSIQTSTFCL